MPDPFVCTYRVQLHRGWDFEAAAGIAEYLAELGVSHLYTSPCLQAAAASTHGYDVVDPTRVNEELGGEAGHQRLIRSLQQHGLGRVIDIVPNHMAIASPDNPWWWDILENGQCSRYATYFDVQWQHPEDRFRDVILLPVLGDHYGRVLEAGELQIVRDGGRFLVSYYDHRFPLSPRSLSTVIQTAAERCGSNDLAKLAEALGQLPHATQADWPSIEKRHRGKENLQQRLEDLASADAQVARAVDAIVEQTNANFVLLDELLGRQNYRLAYWRMAQHDLPYRRFFDINTLVGLRVEEERVFADSHARIIEWADAGVVNGIRVDHPDGLYDPQGYFERLESSTSNAWILAEKILERDETLPESWPIHGTTGYDFLNHVGGLFVDSTGEPDLTACYERFSGQNPDYMERVRDKKLLVLRSVLGSDINRLTRLLLDVCEKHPRHRDYARGQLAGALTELVADFPVYRTYVRPEAETADERDIRWITEAVEAAKRHRPDMPSDLFEFIGQVLQLQVRGEAEQEFLLRFQQVTGPAMAKGVEDTAFYCFNRLVSLNEVGGDPGRFGQSVEGFHQYCLTMQAHWPESMLTTSTHDTKRSEDVRARISLLSEIPGAWQEAVARWSSMNEQYRRNDMPDRNTEYLLYQNLVGAWPIDAERMAAYAEKASREAKTHTSWIDPDPAYDEALQAFVAGIMNDPKFVADLDIFVQPLVPHGYRNALAQTLIKLTAPGVPDIYQGNELWDFSLVDPDNRRPVDYGQRRSLLAELDNLTLDQIRERADEGLPKLWLIRRALAVRRQHPEAFGPESSYEPLYARGRKSDHVVAFVRGQRTMTVAPRLSIGLADDWEDTTIELPRGDWENGLADAGLLSGTVRLDDLLSAFPVALLVRKD